ncbi:hypothetical protein [uncultured Bacteroides sp.]|jgi:hypothetical protein|uniref:hypothetical protein n=1 Tax=uncultured Bacteroides sp. TaxID=162156 RepID=UPI0025D62057|nr:hypothetical protein [uncultured Bacteroides sp.]
MTKVIHVHLIFEKEDHYFGSIEKVYNELDENTLGIKKSYLYKMLNTDNSKMVTKRAIIKRSVLK